MRRVAALVIVLVLVLPAVAQAQQIDERTVRLWGLDGPISVTQDAYGIRHVQTETRHDLWFTQGWIHAEDRLFQMDLSRRQASGTLAEVLGPEALPSDVELRTLGIRRAALRSLAQLSPETRHALRAYAAGVNAWVRRNPLPDQYAAVELTHFKRWTALDSVAVGKLITFGLSFDLDIDRTLEFLAYQQAGAAGGFDGAALFSQDVYRSQPFGDAATVPDATGDSGASALAASEATAQVPAGDREAMMALGRRYLDRVAGLPLVGSAADGEQDTGSNEWAVLGSRTESGFPLIANDPHLGLDTPSTFYPLQLTGDGLDVSGESFPGSPGIVQGQNARIAWGSTVNPLDVTDVYSEQVVSDSASPSGFSTLYEGSNEPIKAIPQVYFANDPASGEDDDLTLVPPSDDVPPVTLIVPRRNNGPILEFDPQAGTALSVQYTGFSGTRELDAFLAINDAAGLEDFQTALQYFDVGSQNFAYADVDGNIAYLTSAELPLREDLQAGTVAGLPPWFIRNGTGGNEWLPAATTYPGQAVPYEILPPGEMPQVVNPSAGWFVNANNDPAGVTLDNNPINQLRPGGGIYYLNVGYDGFRATRITDLVRAELAEGGTMSFADMQAIQADTALLDAQVFVPSVVRALERAQVSSDRVLAALAADPAVAEAVGRLAAWDTTTPTGIPEGYDGSDVNGDRLPPSEAEIRASVAATIYSTWRGQALRNVLDATLARQGLPPPSADRALEALRNLLDTFDAAGGVGASGLDFFVVPGVGDPADRRDVLLLRSVADALALLRGPEFAPAFGGGGSADQDDYRWGLLHRLVLDNPLGGPFNIPPAGGALPQPLPNLSGFPVDGGLFVVDVANHQIRPDSPDDFMFGNGPNRRYVGELNPAGIHGESSLPGGTSGVLGDPFYANLVEPWLTNDTYPVLRHPDDLIGITVEILRLRPWF